MDEADVIEHLPRRSDVLIAFATQEGKSDSIPVQNGFADLLIQLQVIQRRNENLDGRT